MRPTFALLSLALMAPGCRSTPQDEQAGPTRESPEPGDTRAAGVRARMRGHETHGRAMRDAVERGDLDVAKVEAKALANLPVDGPIDGVWRPMLDGMKIAAGQMASAKDLAEAASDVGLVAKTCGDCHGLLGRRGVMVGDAGLPATGATAAMQSHHWAAARLWDGLVVPSNDAWQVGALALSEAPLSPELLTPGRSPVPRVGDLVQSVHNLGRKAQTLESADARAELYGHVLATCSSCHGWSGGGPRPEERNRSFGAPRLSGLPPEAAHEDTQHRLPLRRRSIEITRRADRADVLPCDESRRCTVERTC